MNTTRAKTKIKVSPPDWRTQLFNEGLSGRAETIQVSADRIYQVNGILLDIDPPMLRDNPFFPVTQDAQLLYTDVIKPMLDRHPVLQTAKVVGSGTGLHVLLMFDKPEPCDTDIAREKVAAVIDVVRHILPIDPESPRITATTRRPGSVNSKCGKKVRTLNAGEPVAFSDVENLAAQMVAAPFSTMMAVLAGMTAISPCPICKKDKTMLRVMDHCGICYGSCGKVTDQAIWDLLYQPRIVQSPKGGDNAQE